MDLLRRDADNASPQSRAYTVAARQSRRFVDVHLTEFGFNGAAALGGDLARISVGNTLVHFCPPGTPSTGCPTGSRCNWEGNGETGWIGPVAWTGSRFELKYQGVTVYQGELSADCRTLLWFKAGGLFGADSHWINLPLDVARSVSGRLVFAAAGEAAKACIVREQGCGSEYPIIDYNQPLRLEVWLGP